MGNPVLIGDILHRIKRPIDIEPTSLYKLVTVKLYHKGVVLREEKLGADIKSKMYQVKEGDFILSGIDARNGAFGIVPSELDGAIVTNDFWYFEIDDEVVDKSFFLELTATRWFDEICRKGSDGTTQRIRLQKGKFFNQTIYLSEIGEQREFNKRFQSLKKDNGALSSELTHQQTLLKKLRQQILQEAIEGKLTAAWRDENGCSSVAGAGSAGATAQNPDAEPASELLKRIAAEKAQLVKDKKIKAQKPLPPITDEEKPFDLPPGWEWCRLEQILVILLGGYAFKSALFKKNGTKQVLRLGNIRPYMLRPNEKPVYIDDEYAKEAESVKLSPGDILITMTGTRGKRDYCYTVLLDGNDFQRVDLYLNQRVGCFRFSRSIIKKYYDYCLKDDRLLDQIFSTATGAANQANIGSNTLRSWLVPLPSVEEQQAIVTKVEKLLDLCDQLETQITQNQTHAEQLMQAVLKEAFSHNSAAEPVATTPKAAAHA